MMYNGSVNVNFSFLKKRCMELARTLDQKCSRVKEAVKELNNVFSAIYEPKGTKKTTTESVLGTLK